MEVTRTNRGFEYIEFKDLYDIKCSLQQSSIALYEPPGTSAVWLGCDKGRMHLNVEQVGDLVEHLTNWLKHGRF